MSGLRRLRDFNFRLSPCIITVNHFY